MLSVGLCDNCLYKYSCKGPDASVCNYTERDDTNDLGGLRVWLEEDIDD